MASAGRPMELHKAVTAALPKRLACPATCRKAHPEPTAAGGRVHIICTARPASYSVGPIFHRHRESREAMDSDHLKTIPLFSSLSDKALNTVAVFAGETSVSAGKRIVREGDYAYDLIVIETGTADVIKDGEVIGSLGPGDVFGEMGVLAGGKRMADVVATSSMRLITLTKADLRRISTEIGGQLQSLIEERQKLDEERAQSS